MPKRELPLSHKGTGEFERVEPTSHEFRARKQVFALSIAIILFVAAGGELNPGGYGLIKVGNAAILESALYLAFLWTVYRYRVVCFDRITDFHKKAIRLIEQNVGWGSRIDWLNLETMYKEAIKNITPDQDGRIRSRLGSVPASSEELKKFVSEINYQTYIGKGVPDLLHNSHFEIRARKVDSGASPLLVVTINIDGPTTRRLFFHAYKLLIRYDDSFSEWIAPWFLISIAFLMLYFRLASEIKNALG